MPIDVQFPGNLGQVDTIAKLRQVPTTTVDAETIYIAMDVGRTYSFDFGSLLNDDGINVIRPNDRMPLQAGRFIYLVDGFAPGAPGAAGPAGPADNTYTTLAALLASDPTRKSARLVPQAGETAPAGNFNYVNGAWVRQGADGLTFQPLGATAAIDAQAKLRQTVAVTDYPGSPNEQWAAALAAVAAGGEIILPQGVTMTYDVSGGFAGALNVGKPVTIRILGRLQTNGHGTRSYIFRVTSVGVKIIVEGVLAGDGSVDDANSGDITTHPGLIYVEANGFRLSGPGTIDTPPKVAVVLANCYDCVIEGVTAVGGPANYSGTAYFFAIATGGGRHKFTNLKAPAATGPGNAKFVNLIFFGGSLGDPVDCIVSNCSPVVVWEKVAYAHGSGHLIQGNKGAGDKTDWVRLWGDNGVADGNVVSGSNAIVTVLDGKGCVVKNNEGYGLKQGGVVVARNNPNYSGGFSGTIISGNVLISDSASSGLQDGILIIADGVNGNDIQVINNTVSGFAPSGSSRAQIKVSAVSPYAINRALIANNVCTDSPGNAIVTDRVISSALQGNQGRNIGGALLSEVGGAFNRWLDNTGDQVANKGVQGISSASEKSGNRFTNGALTGQATLAAGTITVSNTEVLDGDEILLSVAASGGTPGFLSYSIVAGTSFTIVSSSNTDASVVRWRINH